MLQQQQKIMNSYIKFRLPLQQQILLLLLLSGCFFFTFVHPSTIPVVMYHGMGDTAYGSINSIKTYLQNKLPGIYVTSIRVGNTTEEDFLSGYFVNLNEQV